LRALILWIVLGIVVAQALVLMPMRMLSLAHTHESTSGDQTLIELDSPPHDHATVGVHAHLGALIHEVTNEVVHWLFPQAQVSDLADTADASGMQLTSPALHGSTLSIITPDSVSRAAAPPLLPFAIHTIAPESPPPRV
jgi:hypothetical protein